MNDQYSAPAWMTADGGDRDPVALIRRMAADGHSHSYIATALTRLRIPTVTGKTRWGNQQVAAVAARAGVQVRWRPR